MVENFLVVKNLTPEMSPNVTPKWRHFNEKMTCHNTRQLISSMKKRTIEIKALTNILTTGDNLLTISVLFQVTAPIDQNYPEISQKSTKIGPKFEPWDFWIASKTLNFRNFWSSKHVNCHIYSLQTGQLVTFYNFCLFWLIFNQAFNQKSLNEPLRSVLKINLG